MPGTTTFTSAGKAITTERHDPSGKPNGGVVVIAYGTDGMTDDLTGPWGTMIRGYATDLAAQGFVALIPDYFSATGTKPGPVAFEQIAIHRDTWQGAVADAVKHAKTLPGVDATRVALIGFSLGGHLCVRLRAAAKVLIEFFAPELDGLGPGGKPTLHAQIHHGEADRLVPLKPNAEGIDRALRAEGASPELYTYAGAGHGFAGTDPANTSARTQSKARAIAFCVAHL